MATTEILCIGSVLWDIIGRTASHMKLGSDVPGRIVRVPGGVAMNIAVTLSRFGLRPVLLTALGNDDNGLDLLSTAESHGMETGYVYISDDLPTDTYMAVEGANGTPVTVKVRSGQRPGERALVDRSGEIPPQYRKYVEEYYRALSRER